MPKGGTPARKLLMSRAVLRVNAPLRAALAIGNGYRPVAGRAAESGGALPLRNDHGGDCARAPLPR